MAHKDNRGPNWQGNGFDNDPARAVEAGRKGGLVKSAKNKLLDSISDGEVQQLEDARKLYLDLMTEDMKSGDTDKFEFWEKTTGNHKDTRKEPEEVKEDTNKLDINISITGEDPKE